MESKKLNTNSNVYTIVYAVVMVVIVALLLAFTSGALRTRQQANIDLDRQKQILYSLNIDLKGQDAAQVFEDVIGDGGIIVNSEGAILESDIDATFNLDISKQAALPLEERQLPIFLATIDGESKFVIPVSGAGLWGGIWGYIAINSDGNEIYGTYFNHESETPGLGAEITKKEFQHRFIGKHLFDAEGNFVSVAVTKNGAPAENQDHVDALSGATITSKGVEAMLLNSLGQYKEFLAAYATSDADQEADNQEDVEETENTETL